MNKIKLLIFYVKQRIIKSEFSKNVLILSGGTLIAQALPVLISPVLTRLYSPSDFGTLALFISITSIVGVIANGRYELAIMLPEKDEDAINIAAVGFLFNIVISLLFLIVIILFKNPILGFFKAEALSFWIYLAPLTVFFIGLFNILNYANNRFKLYKDISKSNILKSIAGNFVQLILGFIKIGTSGLILGQMTSQIIANTKLFSNIKKTKLLKEIKRERIFFLAKEYDKFPKYSFWAGLLNVLGFQFLTLIIGYYYGTEYLGYYSLSYRILSAPSSLIGTSISQVFYKYAVDEKNKVGNSIKTFKNTILKLVLISLPSFFILFIFIKKLIIIVFGKSWILTADISKILIPFIAINFIARPLTLTMAIFRTQKIELLFNIGILLTSLSIISFPNNFILSLKIYSLILFFYYLIFIFIFYYISKNKLKRV